MTAVNQLITEHMEIWTAAIEKKSGAGRGNGKAVNLYGLKKLRQLILELAVRGKLVPQDPADGKGPKPPKRQSRPRKNGAADARALAFEPPNTWSKARFEDFFSLEYGVNLPDEKRSQTGEVAVYGSNGVVGTHRSACVYSPCIVVGRKGSSGALNLCLDEACWVTDVAYSSIPPEGVDIHYAMILFSTLKLDTLGKGIKPGLSRNEAYALPIALPPLAEQRRIIAKVDELMVLCDTLEAQAEDSLKAHQTLVETCLATLTNSQNPEDLAQNWARLETHFDILFSDEESVERLRQTVYLLATQGKLVTQDPTEVAAKELIRDVSDRRRELLDAGYPNEKEAKTQIKKSEQQIIPEGLPELPPGWEWATLMQASLMVIDCKNKTAPYSVDGVRLIRTTNVRNGRLNEIDQKYVDEKTFEAWSLRAKPEPGDLLITREAPMGEACLIPDGERLCLGQRMMLARLVPDTIDKDYLLITFLSPDLMDRVQDKPLGITVEHLRVGGVETLLVPIPPKAEQARIVESVHRLVALCEQVRARIQIAQGLQIVLSDTLVERAA